MSSRPTSAESLDDLRALERTAADRGDRCLAILLAGVDLYLRVGRDLELIELMRDHAEQIREAVENTPTADDLRRLYEA